MTGIWRIYNPVFIELFSIKCKIINHLPEIIRYLVINFTKNMRFEDAILPHGGQPITRQLLLSLLKEYKRPFDKIAELVRQQMLTPVKRGVFIPGPALKLTPPEPFLLANHLAGPSYISFETALSYWQLIPEKVFETASATTGLSKLFDTPAGRFSYRHLPLPYYSFGQQTLPLTENQFAIIASAEKAICDKIIATPGLIFRSPGNLRQWLTEDMRMERAALQKLNIMAIGSWLKHTPKKRSLQMLIQTLSNI
jgi:hypothetical protein